ncbi:MAG: acetate--CoA ligase family protein [Pararhodobacter sp.]|nr:acetate--CoA ligase family protein [Pararhodobacter sp.]
MPQTPSAETVDAPDDAGRSSSARLARLMRPRSVAVIGASANTSSWGGATIANLQAMGFAGSIHPVNPNHDQIAGLPCYPDVEAIPGPVDAALLFVPGAAVPEVLEACGRKGVGGAVILAAGYRETGAEGAQREADLRALADRHGIAVCGPNCMGLVNLAEGFIGYTAAMLPRDMRPGRSALISQSGQLAAVLFTRSHDQGARLRYLVSTGNEMNVDAADYADFMLDDPDIASVGMVLEGLKDPTRFLAVAARSAHLGKPLIVLKLGRSQAAARTALAHTGKLAGAAAVHDAVFRQMNVISVRDPLEIADVAALFAACPVPRGNRIGVVTFSGGWCGAVADQAEDEGLALAEFTPETMDRLRPLLPFTPPVNPLDLSGQITAHPERWPMALHAVHDDPNTDIVVVFIHQMRAAWRGNFVDPLLAFAQTAKKPVVVVYDGGAVVAEGYQALVQDGTLPVYRGSATMLRALRHFTGFHARRSRPAGQPAQKPDAARRAQIMALMEPWGQTLPEHASKQVLAACGLPMVPEQVVATRAEALRRASEIGYPVVLKGLAEGLAHKTESGLVRLNLGDPQALGTAFDDLMGQMSGQRLAGGAAQCLVQPMIGGGVEVLLGLHQDPDFGPMVMVGPGGIMAELIADTAMRRAPFSRDEAEAMIDETRLGMLLAGFRGAPPADRAALVDAMLALGRFGVDMGVAVDSVDINPLIVQPAGRGCVAVDALVIQGRGDDAQAG